MQRYKKILRSYIEFLKFCLDNTKEFPFSANNIDWRKLLIWAEQQAVVGVCYMGLEKTKRSSIDIPFDDLMEWIGKAQVIENQNRKINKKCAEVVKEYRKSGMDIMVLKGQGNALLYPNSLLRTPGDIDILVGGIDRDTLTKYLKSNKSITGHHFHHIEYEENNLPIEVHFVACSMNNPFFYRRLRKWLKIHETRKEDGYLPNEEGVIPVPTLVYNVVFQLTHMMHHFFDEGIGLRQMIDYYYVLKRIEDPLRLPLYKERNLEETLKYLGLWKFAGAVMYIMKEVLGLEEKFLIVPVDERRGKTLLNEILKGGNFGHYSGLDQHNAAKKYFQKTWRNMKLVKEYPAEALCEPVFRTWHFFWRLRHK